MFDQIIVRPSIADLIDFDSIEIINGDDKVNFCDRNGRPDQRNISDHFPIVFSLRRELKQELING